MGAESKGRLQQGCWDIRDGDRNGELDLNGGRDDDLQLVHLVFCQAWPVGGSDKAMKGGREIRTGKIFCDPLEMGDA